MKEPRIVPKLVRERALMQFDSDVQIVIKLGRDSILVDLNCARRLQRQLNDMLRIPQ